MSDLLDVLVIGAGIAGLSAGAALATDRRVAVLEAHGTPATQTTGRSAAQYIVDYGGPRIRPFSAASRPWFSDGGGHAEQPLLTPRGTLLVAFGDEVPGAEPPGPTQRRLDVPEVLAMCPGLRAGRVNGGWYDAGAADIDVAGCVAAFRRSLVTEGGSLHCGERVLGASWQQGSWLVETSAGRRRAALLVNAAGAWADEVAASCGVAPVGLRPCRRTAFTFRVDGDAHLRWPLVCDAGERWYLKPEPGQLLGSLAEETPSAPCDARPEEADVALALERIALDTVFAPRSITAAWAGLRTFAPDRGLVLGPDPDRPTFVWCAGQGGFGIQSAPGVAASIAALVRTGSLPRAVTAAGELTADEVAAGRFRQG